MMTGLKMFVKFPTDSETVYLHILRKNWQKIGMTMRTDGGVLPPLCNFQS